LLTHERIRPTSLAYAIFCTTQIVLAAPLYVATGCIQPIVLMLFFLTLTWKGYHRARSR
jgi:hypothetical protein